MAVNEDLSAYSTSAASNTPASGSNVGPDLDNHLRDIKRNVRRVAERYQGTTTPEAFRGREWLDTSGTAATKLELTMNDGSNEIPYMDFDTSAGTARPIIDGTTVPASSMAIQASTAVNIDGGNIDGTVIGAATPAAGDFTTIDASGNATFNSTTKIIADGFSGVLHHETYGTAEQKPHFIARKANGTFASPTAVVSGDDLGTFVVRPYDDAGFTGVNLGALQFVATENHTATAHGVKAEIYTTPNTTETPTRALTIDQDQSATFAASATFGGPAYLKSYTVATVPAATTNGMIIVSDDAGGLTPAFSDGTNWRRTSDRTIVAV